MQFLLCDIKRIFSNKKTVLLCVFHQSSGACFCNDCCANVITSNLQVTISYL
jgi:hypothetical protein